MKPNKLSFVIIVLIVSLGYFYRKREIKLKETEYFTSERVFNLSIEKANCFSLGFEAMLLKSNRNSIQVLNIDEQKIYSADYTFEDIKIFGNGKGEGCRYNKELDYYDLNDKDYFIFDETNNSISKFDIKGNLLDCYKGELQMFNAIKLKDESFLIAVKEGKNSNFNFKHLDFYEKRASNLDLASKVLPKKTNGYWIYQGEFVKNSNEEIFYITFYSNDIIKFDSDLRPIYTKKLIHHTPLIEVKSISNQTTSTKNDFPSIFSVAATNKYIYLLSVINEKDKAIYKNRRFLDVYIAANGKYYGSLALPNIKKVPPIEISVSNKKLTVLYANNKLCIFNIKNLNDSFL